MNTVTILDDYQNAGLASADWAAVRQHYTVDVVTSHLADEAELVQRLAGSEVVVAMRERTPFPASLLRQLPALRQTLAGGNHCRSEQRLLPGNSA